MSELTHADRLATARERVTEAERVLASGDPHGASALIDSALALLDVPVAGMTAVRVAAGEASS